MKRVFEIEFPDELGDSWMNKNSLMLYITTEDHCSTITMSIRDVTNDGCDAALLFIDKKLCKKCEESGITTNNTMTPVSILHLVGNNAIENTNQTHNHNTRKRGYRCDVCNYEEIEIKNECFCGWPYNSK